MRLLSFKRKLQLPATSALSGSEANLGAAWELVRPCLFPELLTPLYTRPFHTDWENPGEAAEMAGHPHLLLWLLEHRCPINPANGPRSALAAVANTCTLAELVKAYQLLRQMDRSLCLGNAILESAAGSKTPDWRDKVEWLLGMGACTLRDGAAGAAARTGELARLQWLRERGCPVNTRHVLLTALQCAGLEMAEWLVDEAGAALPAGCGGAHGEPLWRCAGLSGDVEKLSLFLDAGAAVGCERTARGCRVRPD